METDMSQIGNVKLLISRCKLLVVLFGMVFVLALVSDTFLTIKNFENILQQISINVCLAIGMTLVILTGGIDLSVGSVLAFSGVVMAGFIKNGIEIPSANILLQFTFHGAVIAGLLTGLALGAFNGLMITRFKIPPFVATLGMLSIARGCTKLWTRGEPITNLGRGFEIVGSGKFLGIPLIIWIPLFVIIVFAIDVPSVMLLVVFRPVFSFHRKRESISSLIREFLTPLPSIPQLTITTCIAAATLGITTPILAFGQPPRITTRYEVLEPETWVGKELPILDNIDIGERLKKGAWLILFYHHDCPDCARAIPTCASFAPYSVVQHCFRCPLRPTSEKSAFIPC